MASNTSSQPSPQLSRFLKLALPTLLEPVLLLQRGTVAGFLRQLGGGPAGAAMTAWEPINKHQTEETADQQQ
jgi:hypothetical protein